MLKSYATSYMGQLVSTYYLSRYQASSFANVARCTGTDGSMSPLVQQIQGSIPGGVVNFHLKIFDPVDSDSSVGWGR